MESSLAFYVECLGMQLVNRSVRDGCNNSVYLWDGNPACKVLLRLAEPPFDGWLQADFQRYGPGMDSLSFVTTDLAGSQGQLRAAGVELVDASDSGAPAGVSFRDRAGVHINLYGTEAAPVIPTLTADTETPATYQLSHFCHTSRDATPHRPFYREILGMETLRDLPQDGMLFLADPLTLEDPGSEPRPLELIAEPGLWELETGFLTRRGPGLQWVCFTTEDVHSAHARLSQRQVPCTLTPTDYKDTMIAFYRDPNGIDIEILLPSAPDGS